MPAGSNRPLRVLFLASEAEPFFKVGGLGDYAGSLPAALKTVAMKEGLPLDIRVGLPLHKTTAVDPAQFKHIANLKISQQKGTAKGSAFTYTHDNIPYYFIQQAGRADDFSSVYSTSPIQDAQKYIFFSLASLELARTLKWKPDIIHTNDWHTAVAAHQLKHKLNSTPFFNRTHSLLVIHNLPFMGAGSENVLTEYGIPPIESDNLPHWSKHFPLILGLTAADKIAAVSPTYMQELKQEEFGNGLKDYFMANEKRTIGILNGIDTNIWDPEKDRSLVQTYSINTIIQKQANKTQMQQSVGFEVNADRPLLVAVSRLDFQKGTDLIMNAIPDLLNLDWNMVILGTGNKEYESTLLSLESRYPERLRVYLEFNARLAHQLYAAGDIFLMPSRYEPCGLSQMIAMRYGNLPVARAVGGLRDTIIDAPAKERTGYLFQQATTEAFSGCLRLALADFQDKEKWLAAQTRAMRRDFSWENSALQYLQVYLDLKAESSIGR